MADVVRLNKHVETDKLSAELKEISRDLDQVTKSLLDLIKVSKSANNVIRDQANSQTEANKAVQKANDNLDILAQTEKEAQKIKEQTTKILAKAKAERTEENKELVKAKIARQEQNRKLKESIQLEKAEVNSIKKLRAENKRLRKERDSVNTSTEEGQKVISQLNDQINQNTEVIKNNSDAASQQSQNVGNYASALDELPGKLGAASQGVKGLGAQFKKLLLNPVIAFIAGIVLAVTGLVKAFKRSRAGQTAFAKGMATVTASINTAIGRLTEFSKKIDETFREEGFNGLVDKAKGKWKEFTSTIRQSGVKGVIDNIKKSAEEFNAEVQKNIASAQRIVDLKNELFDLNNRLSVSIALLTKNAEINRAIADDTTKSFKERESAAEKARIASEAASKQSQSLAAERFRVANEELKLAEQTGKFDQELITRVNELKIARIEADKEALITEKENEKQRNELKQDRLERDLDILIDGFDNVKTINERIINDDQKTFEERKNLYEATADLADTSFNAQIETIKKFTDVYFDENELIQETDAVRLNDRIRELDLSEIIEGRLLEIFRERRLALQDLADLEKQLINETNQEREKAAQEEEKRNKEQEQKKNKAIEMERDLRIQVANQLFEFNAALNDRRLANLQSSLDAGQISEKEYAEEVAKIQRKQAIADKAQGIFNATINTAQGITKAYATLGPLAPPVAALLAVLGGLQIATISAQPIPKFKKGTDNFKGGWAEYGEAGREIVKLPTGENYLAEQRTISMLPKGTQIIPNYETEQILAWHGGITNGKFNQLINETVQTRRAISNLPIHITNIDRNGLSFETQRGNTRIKWANKYMHR
jgi:hypothetical protein